MKVAIVGKGALGLVYGGLLAARTTTAVTFVVRSERAGRAAPERVERIDGKREVLEISGRDDVAEVPGDADVVLVAVRADQIDDPLTEKLARSSASVVILTPIFAHDLDRLAARLGRRRVLAAMPSVVAKVSAPHVTRYWLPRVATTLIEEPRPMRPEVDELVRLLVSAGIAARLEMGVVETNAATTVTFIPVMMGLDIAGSIDALMNDGELLRLALDAAREGGDLAHALGKPAAWAPLLTKFASPFLLKMGVGLARRRAPEAVEYVEEHFGRKLHSQNVSMAGAMVRLAREKRVPHGALERLYARLDAR